jgi:hypothetical protein
MLKMRLQHGRASLTVHSQQQHVDRFALEKVRLGDCVICNLLPIRSRCACNAANGARNRISDLCGPTEFGSAAPINAQRWAVASRVGVPLVLLK